MSSPGAPRRAPRSPGRARGTSPYPLRVSGPFGASIGEDAHRRTVSAGFSAAQSGAPAPALRATPCLRPAGVVGDDPDADRAKDGDDDAQGDQGQQAPVASQEQPGPDDGAQNNDEPQNDRLEWHCRARRTSGLIGGGIGDRETAGNTATHGQHGDPDSGRELDAARDGTAAVCRRERSRRRRGRVRRCPPAEVGQAELGCLLAHRGPPSATGQSDGALGVRRPCCTIERIS